MLRAVFVVVLIASTPLASVRSDDVPPPPALPTLVHPPDAKRPTSAVPNPEPTPAAGLDSEKSNAEKSNAEQPVVTAFTDTASAGPDFLVQGEYIGRVTHDGAEQWYGAQVIAQGNDEFQVVVYEGGLPGNDGKAPLRPVSTESANGGYDFDWDGGSARLSGKTIVVLAPDGEPSGRLVKVRRRSRTLGQQPPDGAVVLFDGSSIDALDGARMTDDGLLMEGFASKETFGDFVLHAEFRTPFMPTARGQQRGNSGLYMQGRYETQILDSFGLAGKNNEAGGIYEISDPALNMCFPPLSWQTYDVEFTAARYDEQGTKTADARITARLNGVLVQDDVAVPRATRAAKLPEGPEDGPLYGQDHGNPVRFRNIWIVRKDDDSKPAPTPAE